MLIPPLINQLNEQYKDLHEAQKHLESVRKSFEEMEKANDKIVESLDKAHSVFQNIDVILNKIIEQLI